MALLTSSLLVFRPDSHLFTFYKCFQSYKSPHIFVRIQRILAQIRKAIFEPDKVAVLEGGQYLALYFGKS